MSLPRHGFWSFSPATRLVTDLSQVSKTAAMGALCNRNITGADLATVLQNTDITVDNVAGDVPGIMAGRNPADQLQIMHAAFARSNAAAKLLMEWLSPSAAKELIDTAREGAFRGAAIVRDELPAALLPDSLMAYPDDPHFDEIVDMLAPEAACRVKVAAACTPEELMACAPALASIPANRRGLPTALCLAATYDHPEVVRHWAEHGGDFGKLVAAHDHRQASDFLQGLKLTEAPQRLVDAALQNNVGLGAGDVREGLVEQGHALLDSTDLTLVALNQWFEQFARVAVPEGGAGASASTKSAKHITNMVELRRVSELAYRYSNHLLGMELLENPNWLASHRTQFLTNLVSAPRFAALTKRLQELPVDRLLASNALHGLARHDARFLQAQVPEITIDRASGNDVRAGHVRVSMHGVVGLDLHLEEHLTSAQHVLAFYNQIDENPQLPVLDILRNTETEMRGANPDRFADLLTSCFAPLS